MTKLWALIFASLLLAPALATAQTLNDTALMEIFADVYDEPYGGAFPTEITNLVVARVFEEANAMETPLHTDCWLVTNVSERFPCTFEGAQEAFRVLAFVPVGEDDALGVAIVLASTVFDGSIVTEPSDVRLTGVPLEYASVVTSPTATLTDGVYTVEFYSYYEDSDAHWFGYEPSATLSHLVIEVGLNHLVLVTNEGLWATGIIEEEL